MCLYKLSILFSNFGVTTLCYGSPCNNKDKTAVLKPLTSFCCWLIKWKYDVRMLQIKNFFVSQQKGLHQQNDPSWHERISEECSYIFSVNPQKYIYSYKIFSKHFYLFLYSRQMRCEQKIFKHRRWKNKIFSNLKYI